jgi:hypothetical protein
MSWLYLLWLLVPVALVVVVYKATTPAFLIELFTVAVKAAIPAILKSQIFKVSPHSKEYWDIKHQLMLGTNKDDRNRLEWELKDILAKEKAGKLPLQ